MINNLKSNSKTIFNELSDLHKIIPSDYSHNNITCIINAISSSDFFSQQLKKFPDLFLTLLQENPSINQYQDYTNKLAIQIHPIQNELDLYSTLRIFRHREMAILSYLQSNHLATPQNIFESLSDLAEAIILTTKDWLFKKMCDEFGTPMNYNGEKQELIILGMGKLGGRELNFSSDIDLIFAYPETGETVGGRKPIENNKFFTRLGQRIIRILDDITEDGFVYRVDMRLRPFGDNGALALSFAAMEEYYQEQGRDWERYAMIKAKILGEDPNNSNHKYLKQMLRPFVYRRYIDFSAIQSLREMKSKINREVRRRSLNNNIKLGAGGIREIEFIVQSFQLMRGGRDKILQQRSLLAVLPHLHKLNLIDSLQKKQLKQAYLFLRETENILQAIDDKQTQTLPIDEPNQLRLINVLKFESWSDFTTQLEQHQNNIRTIFDSLIGEDHKEEMKNTSQNQPLDLWYDILNYQITETDLADCLVHYNINKSDYSFIYQELATRFQDWVKRPIGTRGRDVLRKLLPQIIDQIFKHSDHLILLPRILNIIDKIISRTTYLELLLEKEKILPQLLELCSKSIMISEQISRYPILLDELIFNNKVIELEQYHSVLQEYLLRIPEEDEEALIDGLRQFKQSQLLHIAAADILGELPTMKISDHLTYLAQAIIEAVVNLAWKQVSVRFGIPEHLAENERDFVVIGYGKLGGIELGYNSDLDLVFLHNAPDNSETIGGKKSISSHQFYIKLAQKIISIFNLNTSSGILYDIDMRLRPSGESGLLVSTFNAYEYYQKNEAWTWELQALVRARAVYGNKKLIQKFVQIRSETLAQYRSSDLLKQEIYQMREKMLSHLKNTNTQIFNLKKDRGGIIDIEFIAQFLVLNYANKYAEITKWSDNVRIFEENMNYHILSAEEAQKLTDIYITFRNKIHQLNLLNQEPIVNSDEFMQERNIISQIWNTYLDKIEIN